MAISDADSGRANRSARTTYDIVRAALPVPGTRRFTRNPDARAATASRPNARHYDTR